MKNQIATVISKRQGR